MLNNGNAVISFQGFNGAFGLTIVRDKGVLATFNLFSLWPIRFVVSRNGFYLMTEKLLLFLLRYYHFVK